MKHFQGVEFAQFSKNTPNGNGYSVISGVPGEVSQIQFSFEGPQTLKDLWGGWHLDFHTHSSTLFASPADQAFLKALGQETSIVVMPDGSVFQFTQTIPNSIIPYNKIKTD